jgi:hypothetical protein
MSKKLGKELLGKKIKIIKPFYGTNEEIATIIVVGRSLIYAAFENKNQKYASTLSVDIIKNINLCFEFTIDNIFKFRSFKYDHLYFNEENKFFVFYDESKKCRKI